MVSKNKWKGCNEQISEKYLAHRHGYMMIHGQWATGVTRIPNGHLLGEMVKCSTFKGGIFLGNDVELTGHTHYLSLNIGAYPRFDINYVNQKIGHIKLHLQTDFVCGFPYFFRRHPDVFHGQNLGHQSIEI
jgi:hypothetical protein